MYSHQSPFTSYLFEIPIIFFDEILETEITAWGADFVKMLLHQEGSGHFVLAGLGHETGEIKRSRRRLLQEIRFVQSRHAVVDVFHLRHDVEFVIEKLTIPIDDVAGVPLVLVLHDGDSEGKSLLNMS